ncbi:MAG: hypothetical protein ACKOH9_02145 [Actinomycetota bacterium]
MKKLLLSMLLCFGALSSTNLVSAQPNRAHQHADLALMPTVATTVPEYYDLENEPSACIGFLPKPGCGKEPTDAGERGGALQYLVFGIMIVGLVVVGLGIARGVRKQQPRS